MARGIMAPVHERSNGPVARTDVRRTLVSSQMQTANIQSAWRGTDYSGLLKDVSEGLNKYYKAEKDAAFKRLDIEASKMQMQELEQIRLADSNEQIPEIENSFKQNLNNTFAQDNWGKQWLKERGDLFLAANNRDVMRSSVAKQRELYALEMNRTISTWANDIAISAPDKAKVLIGDMDQFIGASELLSPEEKQKTKDNAAALVLQRTISANPSVAIDLLNDDNFKWGEKGIDVEKYKQTALASMKNTDNKRLISQIQSNRSAASELLAQSQERQLSIDEINKAVPEQSKELRALLYDMNGYAIEDGAVKLSDEQKAIITADLYGRAATLANNKNTSIGDWQQLEKDIYSAMKKGGGLTKSEGQKILNTIATPYINSYKDKLDDAEAFKFVGPNYGFGQVEKLVKDLGLNKEFSKNNYKDKSVKAMLEGQQARQKIKIFQAYNDNLESLLKEEGLQSIDELEAKTSKYREGFYQKAYDNTLQTLNQAKFLNLQGVMPEQMPNAAVGKNDSNISSLSTDINKIKQGTPVSAQIKQVGAKDGKFYARTSDGKTIEITEQQYNQLKGL
jgi:hypothetical protein